MAETKQLSEAILKELLTDAMVVRGYFYDVDETRTPGIYHGSADDVTGTLPDFGSRGSWIYGTLEVIKGRSPRVIQRWTSDTGDVATRTWLSGWRAWKQLTP